MGCVRECGLKLSFGTFGMVWKCVCGGGVLESGDSDCLLDGCEKMWGVLGNGGIEIVILEGCGYVRGVLGVED